IQFSRTITPKVIKGN
ncbi:hypothetical protein CDAR_469611, partial [Caerostris darwini]